MVPNLLLDYAKKIKLKKVLTILFAYVTLVGLVTFSLFIHEESIQMLMFGTWPAKNAKQWSLVKTGTDLMEKTNNQARWINYIVGWVQPLAFFSYKSFNMSTDFYIKGLRAECFAMAPELFIGEDVEFEFHPKQSTRRKDGKYIIQSGKLFIITEQAPSLSKMYVKGTLNLIDNKLTVITQ